MKPFTFRSFVKMMLGVFVVLVLALLAPTTHAAPKATCTVTTNVDDDTTANSLRVLIADASCATINFDKDYLIMLNSQLDIYRNVTIDGTGHSITISGWNAVRVFSIASGVVTLNHLTIQNGWITESSPDGGGGIYNQGTLIVTNCTITNNSTSSGAGIYNNGTLTVSNSTVSANLATGFGGGGGIFNNNWLSISNSTILNNSGGSVTSGGGIYNNGTLIVTNCTITNNSAGGGGGIYNVSSLTVTNTILVNNTTGGNCEDWGSTTDGGGNLVYGDSTCPGINANPKLGALTGSPAYFPLAYNSPAIDVGVASGCPSTDQRGQPRDDLACDSGAYERKMSDGNQVAHTPSTSAMTYYGSTRVGIQDLGSTHPGVITVTKAASWTSQPSGALGTWWDLNADTNSGLNVTLQLCYSTAELRGLTEGNLHFWRYSGGTWSDLGTPASFSGTSPNRCAQISGVTGFSRWTLATSNPSGAPTVVTLSQFQATPTFDLGAWFRHILGR